MSDPVQFQRWLDSFRYKLGYQFRLEGRHLTGMAVGVVRLSTKVRHRDKPEHVDEIHFTHNFYVWPKTVSEFLCLMRAVIHQWEMHEADEWIRYGEERPFDPHVINRDYRKLVAETTEERHALTFGRHHEVAGDSLRVPVYRGIRPGTYSVGDDDPDNHG